MNRDELPQMAAAGGLVLSGGHALLIRKHHLWDLPKGKLSGDEEPENCAVREISEETGLDPALLSVRSPLCTSNYISYYSFGPVNKTVDWFILDYAGEVTDPLTPELSEDIDLCRWIATCDLAKVSASAREYLRPVWPVIRQELEPSAIGYLLA
jgi:8-oxo-dGTP pyrophosphatase MutT (NUDIX family)